MFRRTKLTTAALYSDDGMLIGTFTVPWEGTCVAQVCKGYYWEIDDFSERSSCRTRPPDAVSRVAMDGKDE